MSINEIEEKRLYKKLLTYDLGKFAEQLNLVNDNISEFTDQDAVKLLNIAESYSRNFNNNKSRLKCLTICGLLWEHRKREWTALDSFLVQILSRLGLGPSAIMVDSGFNDDRFSTLGSFIAEMQITAKLVRYEVTINECNTILLSTFQKKMWDAIDKDSRLGISAPTSAGKSFVLAHKIADILAANNGEVVYIVPTISLVNQVTKDIRKALISSEVENFRILQSYSIEDIQPKNRIYVLTQERALAAFSQKEMPFKNLKLLIVDEIQNIERIADESEERAHILYDVINEFTNNVNPPIIIVCGPRLSNIKGLVTSLFGKGSDVTDEVPPVINITYSFSQEGKFKYVKLYSNLIESPIKLKIQNTNLISGFGKSLYKDDVYNCIYSLVSNLENEAGTLIFSPTSNQAVRTANQLSLLNEKYKSNKKLDSLNKYIEDTIHPLYSLANTVKHGIAYHHGKMPLHTRMAIEQAFSEKALNTVTCTTTLMQGVNLPAKYLIARNPNLFLKKNKDQTPKLTSYEFANLRGRAGRLMKDFVGKAIILDEDSFEDTIDYMQKDVEKEVSAGYGERFNEYASEIIYALRSDYEPSEVNSYNDLIVYIRQMILKYNNNAQEILKKVGIHLNTQEFNSVKSSLNSLEVSRDICIKNRYWDPFVLDRLYKWSPEALPNNPFDGSYVDNLFCALMEIKDITPYYYKKYLDIYSDSYLKSLVLYSHSWSKETRLKDILLETIERDPLNADKLDDIISDIINKVCYAIPKLLKPIIDLQDSDNPLLNFIEMGAYYPITRKLMNLGIPRETALSIKEYAFKIDRKVINFSEKQISDLLLKKIINKIFDKLNYWEQKQVEDIIR